MKKLFLWIAGTSPCWLKHDKKHAPGHAVRFPACSSSAYSMKATFLPLMRRAWQGPQQGSMVSRWYRRLLHLDDSIRTVFVMYGDVYIYIHRLSCFLIFQVVEIPIAIPNVQSIQPPGNQDIVWTAWSTWARWPPKTRKTWGSLLKAWGLGSHQSDRKHSKIFRKFHEAKRGNRYSVYFRVQKGNGP